MSSEIRSKDMPKVQQMMQVSFQQGVQQGMQQGVQEGKTMVMNQIQGMNAGGPASQGFNSLA